MAIVLPEWYYGPRWFQVWMHLRKEAPDERHGTNEATFQHVSLTSEDNNHIRIWGLTEGQWSERTLNFT